MNENKFIDLHTHSTCSDGSMTPRELVRHAKECGLSAVAVTDHDNVSGVLDAVDEGKKIGIEVVPGVELSAIADTETHILGYYIDPTNEKLNEKLAYAKKVRYERQLETCRNLRNAGFDVSMEEAEAEAGGDILCRAHFAKLMVKKGYVDSVKNAFALYLSYGKVGYSGKQAMTDEECVEVIKEAGGVSFLAHLHLTKKPLDELYPFVARLKAKGLSGVEGYYTDYNEEMQEKYQKLAYDEGLIISGGTDFHGTMKPHISIGKGLGNLRIPYSVLEGIKTVASCKL